MRKHAPVKIQNPSDHHVVKVHREQDVIVMSSVCKNSVPQCKCVYDRFLEFKAHTILKDNTHLFTFQQKQDFSNLAYNTNLYLGNIEFCDKASVSHLYVILQSQIESNTVTLVNPEIETVKITPYEDLYITFYSENPTEELYWGYEIIPDHNNVINYYLFRSFQTTGSGFLYGINGNISDYNFVFKYNKSVEKRNEVLYGGKIIFQARNQKFQVIATKQIDIYVNFSKSNSLAVRPRIGKIHNARNVVRQHIVRPAKLALLENGFLSDKALTHQMILEKYLRGELKN